MKEHRSRGGWPFAILAAVVTAVAPATVAAHDLILRYDLPLPFSLYLYTCGAVLVATFVLFGWFVRAQPARGPAVSTTGVPAPRERTVVVPRWAVSLVRALAVACLLITIGAALFAPRHADRNIGVTLFWHVFLLGWTYATLIAGNVYEFANPWKTVMEWFERAGPAAPRYAYPPSLGYWPAFALYVALVWFELFSLPTPRTLGAALIVYSVIVFAGVRLFGAAMWFRYGDLFAVFLRVVGMLAPVAYRTAPDGQSVELRLRAPFIGALEHPAENVSQVVFVLFMLASTTYDGMHQTIFWMGLYYNHLLAWLQPLLGFDLITSQVVLEKWYVVYQRLGLVLFPFLYLAIYLGVLRLAKAVTGTPLAVRTMALEFAFTIVPIALVYNMAHYFTLLLLQLAALPYLLADPLGLGWRLFGLPTSRGEPPILNMALVWHTEVSLILVGHVISVYLAHRAALRLFPSPRAAMVSQLPILMLMVAYTVLGLWVISLPFALT